MGSAYRLFSLLRTSSNRRLLFRTLLLNLSAGPTRLEQHLFATIPLARLQPSMGSTRSAHSIAGAVEAYGYGGGPVQSRPLLQELSRLVDHLAAGGYADSRCPAVAYGFDDDSFVEELNLAEDFVRIANICLSFARDRPDALRFLSRKDVDVVVKNSAPSLFKNGVNSVKRLQLFLNGEVLHSENVQTVDVMRYILSYAHSARFSSNDNNVKVREITEVAVQNLLSELVNISETVQQSNFLNSMPRDASLRFTQFQRHPGQNIEMKKGDWICPKCSFMNFARNIRCLECNEGRPKRQLAGGEWECHQCNFFNYSRNIVCLRCNCQRPADSLPNSSAPESGFGQNSNLHQIQNTTGLEKSEIDRNLAANDEKAERWFSKMSQLDDSSDLSSAIADEDFPEVMPLRKGVNRFVISTRKTPLERRLANAQYQRNLENSGLTGEFSSHSGNQSGKESDKAFESSISVSLDRILGRTTAASVNQKTRVDPTSASSLQHVSDEKRSEFTSDSISRQTQSLDSETGSNRVSNFSDAHDRCYSNNVEHQDATDLASAINFPEVMPLRKGENHFIVSKKKDRTLTSAPYKRRMAMEQANNTDFVPFVPFPPDYFAKKGKQPETDQPAKESSMESSGPPQMFQNLSGKLEEMSPASLDNHIVESNVSDTSVHSGNGDVAVRPAQSSNNSSNLSNNSSEVIYGSKSSQPISTSAASFNSWSQDPPRKSLEGSAVTEPDPLDMSEEAKAQRWFRRVAQIKDISELANIPDEDFPEIMPMRKGVNRFVVSKRKTPLERRLTSAQYRRNLPVVSSDPSGPEKDSN